MYYWLDRANKENISYLNGLTTKQLLSKFKRLRKVMFTYTGYEEEYYEGPTKERLAELELKREVNLKTLNDYFLRLKEVLSTREHVPKKYSRK